MSLIWQTPHAHWHTCSSDDVLVDLIMFLISWITAVIQPRPNQTTQRKKFAQGCTSIAHDWRDATHARRTHNAQITNNCQLETFKISYQHQLEYSLHIAGLLVYFGLLNQRGRAAKHCPLFRGILLRSSQKQLHCNKKINKTFSDTKFQIPPVKIKVPRAVRESVSLMKHWHIVACVKTQIRRIIQRREN